MEAINVTSLLIFQNLQLPHYQLQMTFCTKLLIGRYGEVQSSIVYENVGTMADIILSNEMLNTTRIINIRKYSAYAKNELEPYFMLTVIIENLQELGKYFDSNYRILGWNSRAKHLIIYLGDEDLDKIFLLSWEKFIIRLIVMDRNSDLYTYDPLSISCGKVVKKKYLFECDAIDFAVTDNIMDTIGLKDYKGCEVRVLPLFIKPYVIDERSGFELNALQVISKKLNFKITFVEHNFTYWGYKTQNNTYTDMYGTFLKREADLMIGMLVANGSYLYDFDSSIAHTKSDLAFFVPPAKKSHPWENMIKVYAPMIWGAIGAVIVLMSIFWYVVAKSKKHREHFDEFSTCWCYVFALSLSESLTQPKSHSFRYIFIVWALYSLVLSSTFESALMSFLTKPSYEKEIRNNRELVERGLQIGGFEYARDLFTIDTQNEHTQAIYRNWVDCDLNEGCVNRTAEQGDFAAINDVRLINYLTPFYYLDEAGLKKYYQMPVTSSFYMWILFLKGFPLVTEINKLLQRFIEFGLLDKWQNDLSYNYNPSDDIQHVALSLEHVLFPLVALSVGCVLSILVFIFEVIYYKFKQGKDKVS